MDSWALWLVGFIVHDANMKMLGKPMTSGIDDYVWNRRSGTARFELLETADEIIAGLTAISSAGQIRFLEHMLDEIAERKVGRVCETELAWRHGNIEFFARGNAKQARADPEQHKALHTTRNVNWTANIRRILDRGKRTLIVGGAARFAGEESVLQMLKRNHGVRADRIE